MTPGAPGELGALRLLGESFRLLVAQFGIFFPLAFAPALLMEAVTLALVPAPVEETMQITAGVLVASLLGAVVGYLVVAVLCLAALDAAGGRRRGLDAYVGAALPHLLPLVVLGTILSIAAGIALLFLVIPGLYVLAQFLVWVQALVFERAGLGALGRAQALTRGHRWPLVGALLVLGLLFVGGLLLATPVLILAADGVRLIGAIVNAALVAVLNALVAIYSTLVYLRLRALEDGASPDRIAAAAG